MELQLANSVFFCGKIVLCDDKNKIQLEKGDKGLFLERWQSCHIFEGKSLKLPYLDNTFQEVVKTKQSKAGFQKLTTFLPD